MSRITWHDGDALTPDLERFIDDWSRRPGSLIMVLHRVQEEYGYVPREVAAEVSRRLDVPLAQIYGVLTFYQMFRLEEPGKHRVQVCMGTACYLRGAEGLMDELKTMFGVESGGTTDDKMFTIEGVRCVGCCGLAPVVMVDGEAHGHATPEELPGILAPYRDREEPESELREVLEGAESWNDDGQDRNTDSSAEDDGNQSRSRNRKGGTGRRAGKKGKK